jgi:MerR family transcriptional regulator/heat shock protein HspR
VPRKRATTGKGYYMISAVALRYNIHPQTLRLYEREGLLKPSRTEGNTRLYSDDDLQELETILALTRDLGVNLAGVEIILNMRRKMERMQREVNEFMQYVKGELARGLGDWEQRLTTALVQVDRGRDVRSGRTNTEKTEDTERTEDTESAKGAEEVQAVKK